MFHLTQILTINASEHVHITCSKILNSHCGGNRYSHTTVTARRQSDRTPNTEIRCFPHGNELPWCIGHLMAGSGIKVLFEIIIMHQTPWSNLSCQERRSREPFVHTSCWMRFSTDCYCPNRWMYQFHAQPELSKTTPNNQTNTVYQLRSES